MPETTPPLVIDLPDQSATETLARRMAPHLRAGDVLALSGAIGAGKSTFARALITARLADLGRAEDIPSPTFTLVQTYDAGETEIWHCDLYRLNGPEEVWELGLDAAFEAALCLIEWPDRLGADLPDDALHVTLTQGASETARRMALHSHAVAWRTRLRDLMPESSARA
jgi:tRNA threonylcarbamoyladenosine biosynthesis protein TsaE